MATLVKKEPEEASSSQVRARNDGEQSQQHKVEFPSVIDICSSSDDSASDSDPDQDDAVSGGASKKRKLSDAGAEAVLPLGVFVPPAPLMTVAPVTQGSKQFWKAGDYEGAPCGNWEPSSGNVDCSV